MNENEKLQHVVSVLREEIERKYCVDLAVFPNIYLTTAHAQVLIFSEKMAAPTEPYTSDYGAVSKKANTYQVELEKIVYEVPGLGVPWMQNFVLMVGYSYGDEQVVIREDEGFLALSDYIQQNLLQNPYAITKDKPYAHSKHLADLKPSTNYMLQAHAADKMIGMDFAEAESKTIASMMHNGVAGELSMEIDKEQLYKFQKSLSAVSKNVGANFKVLGDAFAKISVHGGNALKNMKYPHGTAPKIEPKIDPIGIPELKALHDYIETGKTEGLLLKGKKNKSD